MSTSNNRRSNNRSSGSNPQRRASDGAKKSQRTGAQRSAVRRASEAAAEAASDADGPSNEHADDDAPRLPAAGTNPAARERAARGRSGSGQPSSKSSNRSSSGRNGAKSAPNGARRSAPAGGRHAGSDTAPSGEGRTRRPAQGRSDDTPRRPTRRQAPPKRYEVFFGEADLAVRDHSLEALWYEIADQWGPSDVGPIALVPVPPMTTVDAARYAERFVSIGAAIDGDRVKLITALDLWPSDTTLAQEIEQSRSERTAIVLEAPSLNPASIPIIRRCTTVVPVVQLGLSEEDEVAQLVASLGRTASATLLCVDRPKRRRGLARFRRSPKKVAAKA